MNKWNTVESLTSHNNNLENAKLIDSMDLIWQWELLVMLNQILEFAFDFKADGQY